jgi:hypothetical protein
MIGEGHFLTCPIFLATTSLNKLPEMLFVVVVVDFVAFFHKKIKNFKT